MLIILARLPVVFSRNIVNSRLRAVFYYLLKVGDFIVRTKFVPKQKRLNHGYLFFDNKKPSKEGVFGLLILL